MAWTVEDRRSGIEKRVEPYLTVAMKQAMQKEYFHRYPTRRACLLPVLHAIQHAYNWIPPQALEEAAEFLSLAPAEVLDTASFYEEYWLKPKGQYLLQVCRSLSCEICASRSLTEHLKRKLEIDVGETTADGRFTLIELECLGSCGTAPVMMCNEVLHEDLTIEKLDRIIGALPADPHQYRDPTVTWDEASSDHSSSGNGHRD